MAEQRQNFAQQIARMVGSSLGGAISGGGASGFLGIQGQDPRVAQAKAELEDRKATLAGINSRSIGAFLDRIKTHEAFDRETKASQLTAEEIANKRVISGIDDPPPKADLDPEGQELELQADAQTNTVLSDLVDIEGQVPEGAGAAAKAASKAFVIKPKVKREQLDNEIAAEANAVKMSKEDKATLKAISKERSFEEFYNEAEAGMKLIDQLDTDMEILKRARAQGLLSNAALLRGVTALNERMENNADRTQKFAKTYYEQGGGKRYLAIQRSFVAAEAAYERATQSQKAGGRPGPADYMLMFAFIKNLDDSVVRQSEIEGFQNTMSAVKKVQLKARQLLDDGRILDQPTRDEIVSLMRSAMGFQARGQETRWNAYRNSATRQGLNAEIVVGGMTQKDFTIKDPLPIQSTRKELPPSTATPDDHQRALDALKRAEQKKKGL